MVLEEEPQAKAKKIWSSLDSNASNPTKMPAIWAYSNKFNHLNYFNNSFFSNYSGTDATALTQPALALAIFMGKQ